MSSNINKELVKSWVEALRSEKYKQGRKALRNRKDEYCCLGVLCEISKDVLNLDWKPDIDKDGDFEIYAMEKNSGVLPDKVWEYLGKEATNYSVQISSTNSKLPKFVTEDCSSRYLYLYLVILNDVYKLSFDQIADIIEEEFLK